MAIDHRQMKGDQMKSRKHAILLAVMVGAIWMALVAATSYASGAELQEVTPQQVELAAQIDKALSQVPEIETEQMQITAQLQKVMAQLQSTDALKDAAHNQGVTDATGYSGLTGLVLMLLIMLGKGPIFGRAVKKIPARHRPSLPVVASLIAAVVSYTTMGIPLATALSLAMAGPTAIGLHEIVNEWIGGGRSKPKSKTRIRK